MFVGSISVSPEFALLKKRANLKEGKMRKVTRMFNLTVGFLLIALLLGCAGTRKDRSAAQMRAQRVQAALTAMADALEMYKQDKGYLPKGMATLRDGRYLSIMPDVERDWSLEYYTDGGQVMMLEATSRAAMPDGAGHKIIYRVPDQSWEGYGITEFP